jgi:hypothetical protein
MLNQMTGKNNIEGVLLEWQCTGITSDQGAIRSYTATPVKIIIEELLAEHICTKMRIVTRAHIEHELASRSMLQAPGNLSSERGQRTTEAKTPPNKRGSYITQDEGQNRDRQEIQIKLILLERTSCSDRR